MELRCPTDPWYKCFKTPISIFGGDPHSVIHEEGKARLTYMHTNIERMNISSFIAWRIQSNPMKWTHSGALSAKVGVRLLHDFKNIFK